MKHFVTDLAELRLQQVERDSLLKATRKHIGQCGNLEIIAEDLKLQLEIKNRDLSLLGGLRQPPSDPLHTELTNQLIMLEHESMCLKQLTRDSDAVGELKDKLQAMLSLKELHQKKYREAKLQSFPLDKPLNADLTSDIGGLSSEVKNLLESNVKLQEILDSLKSRFAVVSRVKNETVAKNLSQEAIACDVQPTVNVSIFDEDISFKEEPTHLAHSSSQKLFPILNLRSLRCASQVSSIQASPTPTPTKLASRPASQSMLKPKVSSYKPSHLRMTSDKRELKSKKQSRVKPVPVISFN